MLHIYKPTLDDLWFREMLLGDPPTMTYNHAWGGTISFPKELWNDWYQSWLINENKRFYRYLQNDSGEFVGEVAYHYDEEYQAYMVNVIILAKYRHQGFGSEALKLLEEIAKANHIYTLCDDIAIDNTAISLFLKHGYQEIKRTNEIILLKKELR